MSWVTFRPIRTQDLFHGTVVWKCREKVWGFYLFDEHSFLFRSVCVCIRFWSVLLAWEQSTRCRACVRVITSLHSWESLIEKPDNLARCQTFPEVYSLIMWLVDVSGVFIDYLFLSQQDDCRILRVKVIAGIGLAKKDILGARWVSVGENMLLSCTGICVCLLIRDHANTCVWRHRSRDPRDKTRLCWVWMMDQ